MIRLAVNKQHGGFNISAKALKLLIERDAKCVEITPEAEYYGVDDVEAHLKEQRKKSFGSVYEDIDAGDGYINRGGLGGTPLFKDGVVYDFDDDYPDRENRADMVVTYLHTKGKSARIIMWTRTIDFAYPYLIPASLVGCASRKAILSTTPARDVGINALTYRDSLCVFYIPPSGRGNPISPCGFIPLVSPGFHNPVERNDQHVFTCGLKRGGKGEQRVEWIESVRA